MIAAQELGGSGSPGRSGGQGLSKVAFVADFRYVEMPFSDLVDVLRDPDAAWLARMDAPAARTGGPEEAVYPADRPPTTSGGAVWAGGRAGSVRVGFGPRLVRFPVVMTLGAARERWGLIVVPFAWEPLQLDKLLPKLEGDLELAELDGQYSRLALSGRYTVPLAQVGLGLDRLALHRVAESAVRHFLEDAEAAILAEV